MVPSSITVHNSLATFCPIRPLKAETPFRLKSASSPCPTASRVQRFPASPAPAPAVVSPAGASAASSIAMASRSAASSARNARAASRSGKKLQLHAAAAARACPATAARRRSPELAPTRSMRDQRLAVERAGRPRWSLASTCRRLSAYSSLHLEDARIVARARPGRPASPAPPARRTPASVGAVRTGYRLCLADALAEVERIHFAIGPAADARRHARRLLDALRRRVVAVRVAGPLARRSRVRRRPSRRPAFALFTIDSSMPMELGHAGTRSGGRRSRRPARVPRPNIL